MADGRHLVHRARVVVTPVAAGASGPSGPPGPSGPSGPSGPAGPTPTVHNSVNGAPVPLANTGTVITSVTVTLTPSSIVVFQGMFTWTNAAEGVTGSELSISILDGITTIGGVDAMSTTFPATTAVGAMTWGLVATGFSAGAHTFNLLGFSSSGVGNGAVQATDGSLSLLVF